MNYTQIPAPIDTINIQPAPKDTFIAYFFSDGDKQMQCAIGFTHYLPDDYQTKLYAKRDGLTMSFYGDFAGIVALRCAKLGVPVWRADND